MSTIIYLFTKLLGLWWAWRRSR